jgi:hypothetical protein
MIMIALLLLLLFANPALAQNVGIGVSVTTGVQGWYSNNLYQYQEPVTTTAAQAVSQTVTIPASTSHYDVNAAAMFSTLNAPLVLGIQEMTNPSVPIAFGLESVGSRFTLAPHGFVMVRVNTGLADIFFDNTSTRAAQVRIFALSN